MKLSTKILIAIGAILTLGLLSVIVYQQFEIHNKQNAIEQQVVAQKQLADQLVRSQSTYATSKDIQDLIKNSGVSLQQIQDDLSKLKANVTSVNQVTADSKGVVADHVASTSTGQKNTIPAPTCKDGSTCPDPYGYMKTEQNLALSEPFANTQVPIGIVGFSAWQDKPWSVDILPREYKVTTVVGTDENQRQYYYNQFQVDVQGKTYDLHITQAQTKQVYPEAKFSFWNPRLFLGIDGGLDLSKMKPEFAPDINIQIMSYGMYQNVPDWSLLQLGVGYGMQSKNIQFLLMPFAYNIGKNLPLMNNTYIGPSVMLDPKGNFSVMAGVRVGL